MAGHAQLKFVMTECSKTQIRLTGLILYRCRYYADLRKLMRNNPNLDLVNAYPKFGEIPFICLFVLKILSGNKILTAIKGRKSFVNL